MPAIENFLQHHYYVCLESARQYESLLTDAVILDIGSNIGCFSRAVSDILSYKALHLFEPSKEYSDYSRTLLDGKENTNFYNCALGEQNCFENLYKCTTGNIGWNTILTKDPKQDDGFTNHMAKELINLKTLDSFNFDQVDFMKIDVEGYERSVLNGGWQTIVRHRPHIMIEVAWGTEHPEWEQNLDTYNQLFDLGYKRVEFANFTQDILFEPIK